MKIENTQLTISRVEVVKRVFNDKGQVVHETFEFYYPQEKKNQIGFSSTKK